MIPERPIPPFIAKVKDSNEVILRGVADLDFWGRKLQSVGLTPFANDGRAELIISAVKSRWLAVPFSEFIIAVVTETADGESGLPSLFLLAAFNTNRPFTFIEQRYFRTPYRHASIAVDTRSDQVGFELVLKKAPLILGSRHDATTMPSSGVDDSWRGVIYLPPRSPSAREMFFAELSGTSLAVPFCPEKDRLEINPSADTPVCDWLLQSGFQGQEWRVRPKAFHARSNTFARGK